jgi:uncharacterized membrane protein YebE (DUF533 family)
MNIEKLLGKLLEETVGSGGSQILGGYHSGKKKKRSGSSSLLGNLTSQLSTGKGLMTAIGLGVGAYEIFRSSGQSQTQAQPAAPQNWASPPSASGMPASPPPPPPPPSSFPSAPAQAASIPSSPPSAHPASSDDQEMACRLIRVMIAAAYADGTMDADEEKAILDRLRSVELSQEEKMFLLNELHHPRPIAELSQGITDPRLAQAIYAVALSAIVVDTDSERQWLDELGAALHLSPEICRFIEETS